MNSFGVRLIGGTEARPAAASLAAAPRPRAAPFRAPRGTTPRIVGCSSPLSFLPPPTPNRRPATLTYSHIPSRPPSRPNPLSRYPPNPLDASNRLVELIHTTPALIFGAMSSARLMLSVQMLAARPNGVLLASATDSSGVRKVIVTSTGPKISTCAIVLAGSTLVNNVGG